MTNPDPGTKRKSSDNHGCDKSRRRMASPETIADERVRQERAYQLRLGCHTWQEIANSPHPDDPTRTLYAGPSQARKGFLAALNRHAGTVDTQQLRDEWQMRNEKVFRAIMPACLKGDHWAIDRYTRLFAEHAKMLGLYAPMKEITVITESAVDAAIEQLTEQIAQLEAEVGDDG